MGGRAFKAETVLNVEREWERRAEWSPVLVGSGGVEHRELVKLTEQYFSSLPTSANPIRLGRLSHLKTAFVGSEVRIRND